MDVTVDDLYHIGSISKSFTAVLALILIENPVDTWTRDGTRPPTQTTAEQRVLMTSDVLAMAPRTEGWYYFNYGIVIAGLMLERAASAGPGETLTFEVLCDDYIFEPLGHYGTNQVPTNPSGENGVPDNPPGFNSAGRIHASLADMAKYATMLMNEGAPLISTASFEQLTTPVVTSGAGAGYGLGLSMAGDPSADFEPVGTALKSLAMDLYWEIF